jgi:hypothetical protein
VQVCQHARDFLQLRDATHNLSTSRSAILPRSIQQLLDGTHEQPAAIKESTRERRKGVGDSTSQHNGGASKWDSTRDLKPSHTC